MGIVYANITLKNAGDITDIQRGRIMEKEVRSLLVNALVDTGAWTLIINEEVRQKLGLIIEGHDDITLADGTSQTYSYTEPVRVQWKDRQMTCQPMLLPDATEVLLGAIPLEDLDLIVDPKKEELTGRHGDKVLRRA